MAWKYEHYLTPLDCVPFILPFFIFFSWIVELYIAKTFLMAMCEEKTLEEITEKIAF